MREDRYSRRSADPYLVRFGPFPLLWLTVGSTLLLGGFLIWSVTYFQDPGVYLDGSRRWVTLTRVHPAFVRAAQAQEAAAGSRR